MEDEIGEASRGQIKQGLFCELWVVFSMGHCRDSQTHVTNNAESCLSLPGFLLKYFGRFFEDNHIPQLPQGWR